MKKDLHVHFCEDCHIAWGHDGTVTRKLSASEYNELHSCPECRGECRVRYAADFNPNAPSDPLTVKPEDFIAEILAKLYVAHTVRSMAKRRRLKEKR